MQMRVLSDAVSALTGIFRSRKRKQPDETDSADTAPPATKRSRQRIDADNGAGYWNVIGRWAQSCEGWVRGLQPLEPTRQPVYLQPRVGAARAASRSFMSESARSNRSAVDWAAMSARRQQRARPPNGSAPVEVDLTQDDDDDDAVAVSGSRYWQSDGGPLPLSGSARRGAAVDDDDDVLYVGRAGARRADAACFGRSDRQATGGASRLLQRRWQRKSPESPSAHSFLSSRARAVQQTAVRPSVSQSVPKSADLDAWERFKQLLEVTDGGNVESTPTSTSTPSTSNQSKLDNLLLRGRNALEIISPSRPSESSSPSPPPAVDAAAVDARVVQNGAASAERARPSSSLESRRKLSEKLGAFDVDSILTTYDAAQLREQRRRQTAPLERERQLREEARHHREARELDDLLRRQLRLEGLVLPTPEAPVDEFPELTSEQLDVIRQALRGGPDDELLVNVEQQEVRRKDLVTLNGLEWLNDEIVNGYLSLVAARGGSKGLPRVYAFNTFFLPKLYKDGHAGVRRWTRKVALFDFDVLLIPVHLGVHWCLAVVDFESSSICYYDSMNGPDKCCLTAIKAYLEAESVDKRKRPFDTSQFTLECLRNIPQQMNGSDCGVFACKFAEYASRRAKITFTQDHMPYFRQRMVYEIASQTLL